MLASSFRFAMLPLFDRMYGKVVSEQSESGSLEVTSGVMSSCQFC
jgi:hypothetical protein